jgi:hypothetical protein
MGKKTSVKPLKTAHSTPTGLMASQERAIAALLDSRTIVAAAQKAEIGESTLRRWLREDELFQTKLRQLREEALGHVSLRLQQRASDAVEALFDNIASANRIEPGRAALLRTALDFAFRAGSYNDLADRIQALEVAQQDGNPGEAPEEAEEP